MEAKERDSTKMLYIIVKGDIYSLKISDFNLEFIKDTEE